MSPVELIITGVGTYSEQRLAIGPAARRDPTDATNNAPTQARLDLNIDTTDEGDDFIDDNRVALTGGWGGVRFGDFIADGLLGGRARYTKAIHSGDSDQELLLTIAGAVPLLQATTCSVSGDSPPPPLHLELNGGYRRKEIGEETVGGRVFEATATHHVFVLDQYWLALSGTWTLNDMTDRPATVPRTQRLYRVVISQYSEADRKMSLMTSIEDGSARTTARKVRMYFIGLGWSFAR